LEFEALQGWGTCGPRAKCGPAEHLIWPASEFPLPNLEYKIASKQSSMISRYLNSETEASIAVVLNLVPRSTFQVATLPRSTCPVSTSHTQQHRFQHAGANLTTLSCCRKTTQISHVTSQILPLSNTYTHTSIYLISNHLDMNQREKLNQIQNRWISEFEKMKFPPTLVGDLASRGGKLLLESEVTGCKASASYKVVISHCWSVLELDFHVRESRVAQISCTSFEIGVPLCHQ